MQQLLVLRHAKAVPWGPGVEDFGRALQPVGHQHAHRIAAWIRAQIELPERILCSPSQRTRDTLAPLLRLEPALEACTHFVPQLYHADAGTLEQLLDAAFTEVDRLLIIGHNPGLEGLVADVIRERDRRNFGRLPTGTLAVIDFVPDWFECRGRGQLGHLVRGKHLSVD